jgi:hypothetical protein
MPTEQQVYFGFCPSVQQVKIGVSVNPPGRIKEMRVARPDIELLLSISGGRELERQLHQRFREYHIAGEWFHYASEIQEFVGEKQGRRLGTLSSPRPDPESAKEDKRLSALVDAEAICGEVF